MRNRILFVAILVAVSVVCAAQQTLNNAAIIKMHAAGLGDDVITATIDSSPGSYATGVDDLIALKTAGISDKVMGAMIAKNSSAATPAITTAVPKSAETAPSTTHTPLVYLVSMIVGSNGGTGDWSLSVQKYLQKHCPDLQVTHVQQQADYTLSMKGLLHTTAEIEDKAGKIILQTKPAIQLVNVGKESCDAITADWNSKNVPQAAAPPQKPAPSIVLLPSNPKDYKQFVDSNRIAAEQDDAMAQYALALAYANGIGVTHDNAEAFFWIDLAAKNGYKVDEDFRSMLSSRLKAADHVQIEQREQAWLQAHPAKTQ